MSNSRPFSTARFTFTKSRARLRFKQKRSNAIKLEAIGVGSGVEIGERGYVSFIVWNNDESDGILFECGVTVFPEIRKIERTTGRDIISKIGTVAISHLHEDHAGSLSGMFIWRLRHFGKTRAAGVDLHDYFKLIGHSYDKWISGIDERVKRIPVSHTSAPQEFALSYGGVFYSGDTNKALLGLPEAKSAKVILHEASPITGPNHTFIDDLAASGDAEILAKTWIVHCPDGDIDELTKRAKELGFAGMLQKGQILEF